MDPFHHSRHLSACTPVEGGNKITAIPANITKVNRLTEEKNASRGISW